MKEIREFVNNKGECKIFFKHIFGGGWARDIEKIISDSIKPQKIEKKLNAIGWHGGDDIEITFEKDSMIIKVIFDEYDSISLRVISKKFDKKRVLEWAEMIACKCKKIDEQRRKKLFPSSS